MNSSKGTLGILNTMALLKPWDVIGCDKIRIGRDHDGGYVMLDRLRPEQPVLSYGVGPDISFDLDLARRGHPVFMFDHTVDGPPDVLPQGALFTREGVAVKAQPKKSLGTIESHLRRHKLLGRRDIILKMDIEGAEWPVLSALPDALFNVFEQIVVEFHWLGGLDQEDFAGLVRQTLQRLNTRFTICHVHANNHAGISLVEGVAVPTVIEVTYIRSRLIRRTPSQTLFPTKHDRSNNPAVKDVVLSMYPFLPMAAPAAALSPMARRLDAEHTAWNSTKPQERSPKPLRRRRA